MKYTRQLCVDIIMLNSHVEESFREIYQKILERTSYARGSIYRHETETRTKLNNGENSELTQMANMFVDGKIIGIDGVLSDGINVSVNVNTAEAERIKNDPSRFRVKAEIEISLDR